MEFFNQTSKESKRFSQFLDEISKEFNIDKNVALHFINGELERIYKYKLQIDDIQLSKLENEIKKYIKTETQLKEEVENKEKLIASATERINNLTTTLNEKTIALITQQEKVIQLQSKLTEIKNQLNNTDKEKRLLDYDIMMKSHLIKERNDKFYKYLKLFLTIITILAIITFILLNYKNDTDK